MPSSGNPLNDTVPTTGTDETYTVSTATVDTANPTLESIERHSPADENTASQTLIYEVTFSENVTGIDTSDFVLSSGNAGGVEGTNTGSGSGQFVQTREPGFEIPHNQTVTDTISVAGSGTATSISVAVDITHQYIVDLKIDLIAPDGTVQTLHNREGGTADIDQTYPPDFGSVSIAGDWILRIHDNIPIDDGILNSWTLTINYGNAIASTPVTGVSGSGEVYHVTVSALQDGTYNLDLVSSDHGIKDAAGNPLNDTVPTTGTDETYTVSTATVDTANPTLESIERHSPADENTASQTLIYEVTFSENVTGIDTSDFVLSSGNAGGVEGTNTGSGSGQFVQTREPGFEIPHNQTVTDTISVAGSGTATSISVAVDITHQYIVDLKIDLIAPDGTVQTLHNREGGTADIDQTYPPDFGSVSIAGDWILRIHDNIPIDDGILNSWTLTINYGNAIASTPVTGVSGSGEVYHVTVSALQDGTYNLDLVSSDHGIKDAAGNPLNDTVPTTGTDETYTVSTATVDTANPTLESIERHSPADENTASQTLIYEVTFSENVTGIDTSDFVLSSDNAGGVGGTNTGSGSGQFVQTREPGLEIPYNQTVTNTISVAGSGTATSVSVAVNVTHAYLEDLKIDLIAPDGTTTRTLHNRTTGPTDFIHTYSNAHKFLYSQFLGIVVT